MPRPEIVLEHGQQTSTKHAKTKPIANIKVVGIGGAGCNAVNRMVSSRVAGVDFIALNTDKQALDISLAPTIMQLGANLTRGLGTGGDPSRGELAARESEKEISELLEGADMVFLTAGMGGGTGTGGAKIVAEMARRLDILTVAVVTRPFSFEGGRRAKLADAAIKELEGAVDTLIVLPNDKLSINLEKKVLLLDAFQVADDVLRQGVQGISDIILKPGFINVDFADVKAVLTRAGRALMGIGTARGERRAILAAEAAVQSPMLESSIIGATRLLVNFTTSSNFSLGELSEAMSFIHQMVHPDDASIYMGHVLDESMGDDVSISIIAAGMGNVARPIDREVFKDETLVARREPEPVQQFIRPMPKAVVEPITVEVTVEVPVEKPVDTRRTGETPTDEQVEDLVDIPAFLRAYRSRS